MAKILFLFAIFASALAGHWEVWYKFRKECGVMERKFVNDSVGTNNVKPPPVENKEQCSGQNVVFSSSEEALTKMSKTIQLKIGTETKNVPIMVSEDGTNYLIFQRRLNGKVDFYRNWTDYVNGFGNPEEEYWIGLNALNKLTSSKEFVLTIFLENYKNINRYARYGTFRVDGPETNYELYVGDYSGTAGDAMANHNHMKFSTKDKDNDRSDDNCALKFKGAWWYNSCHYSNLNGKYYEAPGTPTAYADGLSWLPFVGHHESAKKSIMALSLKY